MGIGCWLTVGDTYRTLQQILQRPFRKKTGTMGTLSSQAEIGVWIEAPDWGMDGCGRGSPLPVAGIRWYYTQ